MAMQRRKNISPFGAVVFAGGGVRCLWQAGLWETAAPELKLKPELVTGVSAGATMACMCLSGKIREGLEYFKKISGENKKNFYLTGPLRGGKVFPHYDMYRSTILEIIDAAALRKIIEGPELSIVLSRPPRWLGPRSATVVGLVTYSLEKKIMYPVHPRWTAGLGFVPEIVSVRECRTPNDLADLLLQSSCTPPVVPIMKRTGGTVLDGGLIDNVPVMTLKDFQGMALVMLTRRYPVERIPFAPGRMYVQPSGTPPVQKWDYTNPTGLQGAFDMGRRDGEFFAAAVKKGLFRNQISCS